MMICQLLNLIVNDSLFKMPFLSKLWFFWVSVTISYVHVSSNTYYLYVYVNLKKTLLYSKHRVGYCNEFVKFEFNYIIEHVKRF